MDDADLVSAFLAATSNMSDQERATLAGVTHTTVGRWRRGDWKGVRPGTKRKLLGVLERAKGEGGGDEVDDWVEHALGMVRRAKGGENASPEEVRRIKADILAGCILLARAQGMDASRLEEELEKLGGSPAIQLRSATTGAVLEFLDRESRAADKRAAAAMDLAAAARIEAEESRERRVQVATVQPKPDEGPGWVFSEMTEDEKRRYEVYRREREASGAVPSLPAPSAPPESQPADRQPRAGA